MNLYVIFILLHIIKFKYFKTMFGINYFKKKLFIYININIMKTHPSNSMEAQLQMGIRCILVIRDKEIMF